MCGERFDIGDITEETKPYLLKVNVEVAEKDNEHISEHCNIVSVIKLLSYL